MRGMSRFAVYFSVLGTLAAAPAHAQAVAAPVQAPAAADSAGAHQAAMAFLTAFDSLQWEPFRAYFAEDVTMFFPFPDAAARADGRAAVEARFRRFFDDALAAWQRTGRPGAPRMGITPRDLRVQMVDDDVAVVSFHLGEETPARRSLVFRHTAADGWKLVHWHASPPPQRAAPANAPAQTPAPTPSQ